MVDSIEYRLLDENPEDDGAVLDSLFHLQHELTALRMLAVPLREVVNVLLSPTTRRIPEGSATYFDDVRNYLIRVVDMIETMCDYLMDSLDIYTTQQARGSAEETKRVNQSVARLTAVPTVFLPLTFTTGIYRMNFDYMPERERPYKFYAILALALVLGLRMLVYLRGKKII